MVTRFWCLVYTPSYVILYNFVCVHVFPVRGNEVMFFLEFNKYLPTFWSEIHFVDRIFC